MEKTNNSIEQLSPLFLPIRVKDADSIPVSVKDAARILGMCESLIYKFANAGHMKRMETPTTKFPLSYILSTSESEIKQNAVNRIIL